MNKKEKYLTGFTPLENFKKNKGISLTGFTPLENFKKNKGISLTGFTLVEILIVVAVIAILLGAIAPRFKGMKDEANITKAKAELTTLQAAVESYYVTYNAYPAAATNCDGSTYNRECDFLTAVINVTPRIINSIPADPFRTTRLYQYRLNGNFYAIYSAGLSGAGYVVITNAGVITEYTGGSTGGSGNEDATASNCIFVSNSRQDTKP